MASSKGTGCQKTPRNARKTSVYSVAFYKALGGNINLTDPLQTLDYAKKEN
jgi:hypothetical protein